MKLYIIDKRRTSTVFYRLFLISIITLCVYLGSRQTLTVFSVPIKNMVIMIDAGHGGIDPGAIGKSGSEEDKINLEIALKLRRLIEQSGGLALMVREDENGLYVEDRSRVGSKKREDLRNRHELINTSDADIFLSIHLNSFPQSQYYGAQTFYNKNDKKAKALAELIQNEFITVIDRGNRRTAKGIDNVFILKNNNIPGVLVECGFLSNHEEEQLLKSDNYREKVAWCIFTGIVRYFEQEKKSEVLQQ